MNQQLLKGAGTLELILIDTKEQLELKDQKVKELQSLLRDKENEINFFERSFSRQGRSRNSSK